MGIGNHIKKSIRKIIRPVRWYNLRNIQPISSTFGLDRGMPVDRYYIEKFISANSEALKNDVLEIGDSTYSKKYGSSAVKHFHVLSYNKEDPGVTIIGDLTRHNTLPQNAIDCFICTQTFNFIYDFHKAIEGAWQLLKNDGVLLATVGGISQISRFDMDRWGDFWRFTTKSAAIAFGKVFGDTNVSIECYGNVLSAVAFLEGISAEELIKEELDYRDDNYQLLITIKAVKKSK
jgi:hypothetical protein